MKVLKKELSIHSSDIKGNDVYLPCKENIDIIIKSHKEIMKKNHIIISEDEMSNPLLFWIPKLHNNTYKSRCIASASSCNTKQLSVEVALCLKEIQNHFRKYCNVAQRKSQINGLWSISNTEFIGKINNLKWKSIIIALIFQLYIQIYWCNVKEGLQKLIVKVFKHIFVKKKIVLQIIL